MSRTRRGREPITGERLIGESFQISPTMRERLRELADRTGVSKSELIRRAIAGLLESVEVPDITD